MKMPPSKNDLDFYDKERRILGIKYYVKVTPDQVRQLVHQFSIHYEIEAPEVTFRGKIRHYCYWRENRLSFIENNVTLGVVIHEVAHKVEQIKSGNRKHNAALMRRILSLWWTYDPWFTPELPIDYPTLEKFLTPLASFLRTDPGGPNV